MRRKEKKSKANGDLVEDAKLLRLRDIVSQTRMMGDVEIINECNETLLTLSYTEDNVCSLDKVLSQELLDRAIINYGVRDGRTLFKLAGVEDAE